jgi:hypothetical protein
VTETMLNVAVAGGSSVSDTTEQGTNRTTLCFVGHAIYLPAAALGVATLAGCSDAAKDMILSSTTREAEGYLIDLERSSAEYLSRPL